METYYVYMLRCRDDKFYVGVTNDLDRRLWEHRTGYDAHSFTFKRRPLRLVYLSEFHSILDAIAWEKQLKGWSRKKKFALIKGNFERIRWLATGL